VINDLVGYFYFIVNVLHKIADKKGYYYALSPEKIKKIAKSKNKIILIERHVLTRLKNFLQLLIL